MADCKNIKIKLMCYKNIRNYIIFIGIFFYINELKCDIFSVLSLLMLLIYSVLKKSLNYILFSRARHVITIHRHIKINNLIDTMRSEWNCN